MAFKVTPIGFTKRQPFTLVDDSKLIGLYECSGCFQVYSTEDGEPEIPPVCVNCLDAHNMSFLGTAIE